MSKEIKYLSTLSDTKKQIANLYKDYRVSEHLDQLYELIDYQMKIIAEQRRQIIADKHLSAWNDYYRALEEYDEASRRYFSTK